MGLILGITSIHKILNLLDFSQSVNGGDFKMSDVYNIVAESRSMSTLNDEVAIVALDGCNRTEIADLLHIAQSSNPKAIGLDVLFINSYEGDSYLIDAIKSCPKLILPIALDEQSGEMLGSYFYADFDNLNLGVINLDASSNNQCVRTFRPQFEYNGNKLNAFGVELVSKSDSESYDHIITRQNSGEIISYPNIKFETICAKDILTNPDLHKDKLSGKFVLMGDVENTGDFHLTPISSGTPGVVIHAHIIDTIISNKYITNVSNKISWLIAFIVCFAFMCIKLYIRDYSYKLGLLVMRIIQLASLYLFFAIGCNMFINKMLYIDFAPTLLMITLAVFTYDIWTGSVTLIKIICKKENA